jgi:HEAT repeats
MKLFVFARFAGVFLVIVELILSNANGQQQPIFDGKPLNAWMADFNPKNPMQTRSLATNAIKNLGTNALPFLVIEIKTLADIYQQNPTNFYTAPEFVNRFHGVRSAFTALGSVAKPAVPDLENELSNGKFPILAAEALKSIDPEEAATAFVQALTNYNLNVRLAAIGFLGTLNGATNANLAIPGLIDCLKYESPDARAVELRTLAAQTLGNIRDNPEIVVPALIERLQKETNHIARSVDARSLGNYGKEARTAIPALRLATNDPEGHVSSMATAALKRIEGNSP